jgi:azurin
MVGAIKLTGGGETNTLTFTAGEPGDYPFFCSSPGHFDKMQGKIIVKAK